MTIDRRFLLIAILYGVGGLVLGQYMGIFGDHTQMPTHAHMMMLGWVSMILFAVVYRAWPKMKESVLGPTHFWLFQGGAFIHLIGLGLLYTGNYGVEIAPVLGIGAIMIVASTLCFGFNALFHAKD